MAHSEASEHSIEVTVCVEYAHDTPVKDFPIFPDLQRKPVSEIKGLLVQLMPMQGISANNVGMFIVFGEHEDDKRMEDDTLLSIYRDDLQTCKHIALRSL